MTDDADLLAELDADAPAPTADRRLSTLAEISHLINSILDIDQVLDVIMDRLIALVRAERGFIMLVEGGELTFRVARHIDRSTLDEPAFQISRGVVYQVYESRAPILSFNAAEDPRYRDLPSIQYFGLRAILCVPLRIKDRMIGVAYLDNRLKNGAFDQSDLDFVAAFADQAAIAIDNANLESEKRRLRGLFEGYVSTEVLDEIVARTDADDLRGQLRDVTVMFCDIRGFTSLSEVLGPEAMVARLNEFYEAMGEIIFREGGTLFTYMGDALMAVFGAPARHDDHALRAVRTAMEMCCRMEALQAAWRRDGRPIFRMGVGLCTGEVVVGDVGYARKRQYTVIGDTVNTAARLEKLNKDFHSRVVLSDTTKRAIGPSVPVEPLGQVEVRGKAQAVQAWTIPGFGAQSGG